MEDFDTALQPVLEGNPRFSREAFHFVREALDHTHRQLIRNGETRPRHVTGQELLSGIREYALEQFGPMALGVLREWGIERCEDFGQIVFLMVDARILAKTESDSIEDFQGGYDFDEAFRKPFLPRQRTGVGG